MRKILVTLSLVGAMAVPASVYAGYGMAGCGLGAMVFGDKPGMIQILAMTTNGIAGSQLFGITTGTSECTDGSASARMQMRHTFVAVNRANLSRDAAQGQGEYLEAFATLMGCEDSARSDFFAMAQSNHQALFSPEADNDHVIYGIQEAVRADEKLNKVCHL